MKYSLLYFDDQIQNIECFKSMLQDRFDVIGSSDCTTFEDHLKNCRPHAILLDLHMPGIDGIDLLKKIETSDHYNGCPIFFISGDVSLESRIKTYETGGIDFFDRSLTEHEIVTRLINKIKLFQAGASVLEVGNLRIDTTSHVVQIAGRVIDLTMVEMRLLGLILRTFPSEISKREIMAKIWENDPKDGKLSVHLSNLGSKLWGWNHQIRVKGDAISVHAI